MPRAQQIPGEFYRQHEKIRVYVVEVKRTNKGPEIICSRGHRDMLRRLLEYEVPEIYNGQVEIKSIAREAGFRSKVAVSALQEGIDPVGACVGQRGNRIQNIVTELHNEKIDVIEWRNDARAFITEALRPARVTGVYLDEDIHTGRTAVVIVPDDQLSLAIGREGQNARLAAKLTGWRIDIKSVTETVQSALDNIDLPPLSDLLRTHGPLVEDVRRITEKKLNNRTVMPEEYTILGRFADVVERLLLIEREETRRAETAQMEAVKSTLPEELFHVPLTVLDLSDDLIDSLSPLGSVGAVMLAMLVDEERLRKLIGKNAQQQLGHVQSALDDLMESVTDFSTLIPGVDEDRDDEQSVITPVTDPRDEAEAALRDETSVEVIRDAFGNFAPAVPARVKPVVAGEEDDEDEEGDLSSLDEAGKKDKKARTKRRQLVFDEKTGEVVSKRKRKGNRNRNDWGSDDF
jgi:N utilization substance protein A